MGRRSLSINKKPFMNEYDIDVNVDVIDCDLEDHLDPDHPFELDLGGQG